ncbi:hypothetical protein Leryth_003929 [Lithospermum erythrorhizon]|nr:hypothetical protein Leryth_003929 [Lithospermum erythrorhizon]
MESSVTMPFNQNKHLKQQFVSNLTGSSMLEISLLITSLSIVALLRQAFGLFVTRDIHSGTSLKKDDNATVRDRSLKTYVTSVSVDFLCIIVPYILLLTVFSEWIYGNAAITLLLLILLIIVARFQCTIFQGDEPHNIRESISCYRVCMMLVTCLSILAVDFKIFPRRYAKTETYGTSMLLEVLAATILQKCLIFYSFMDLGVGSFVVANSLVSRQARGILVRNWKNALLSTCPLTFLGFARLISTRGVDYQVHVGEYGVHWNFFFTLAAVAILTSVINVPPSSCGILGLFILVGYQGFLLNGLNEYLLSDKRETNIVSMNKEGIFSIFGYWGMYLIGVQLGNYLFFQRPTSVVQRTMGWSRVRVWIICLAFWYLLLPL